MVTHLSTRVRLVEANRRPANPEGEDCKNIGEVEQRRYEGNQSLPVVTYINF